MFLSILSRPLIQVCGSWFLLAFSSSAWMVYAVRVIMGLSSSIAYVNIGVYISETTHKSLRNMFGAFQVSAFVTHYYAETD